MTICMAIACKKEEKPVLLFASDTQESSLYLKRTTAKIRTIYGREPKKQKDTWGILVASSGDSLVIDEICQDLDFFLTKKIDPDTENPSVDLVVLRKEIGNMAYATYKKYKDRDIVNPEFELLLGASDKYYTILYVTCEGKTQELKEFGIIGSGRITGGELLLNEFFKNDMSQNEAANLAALVVSRVGRVDLSVGGVPDIQMCRDRTVWVFKEEAFNRIISTFETRWSLIKKALEKMQSDKTFEGKLKDLLK